MMLGDLSSNGNKNQPQKQIEIFLKYKCHTSTLWFWMMGWKSAQKKIIFVRNPLKKLI